MKKKDVMSAFLGEGSEFEGTLKFRGTIRIDGHFKGEILSGATLFVGDKGVLEADIKVSRVILTGEVRGSITAEERIEIRAPGRVFGSLQAPTVVMDEGAILVGSCQVLRDKDTPKEPEKAKPTAPLTVTGVKDEPAKPLGRVPLPSEGGDPPPRDPDEKGELDEFIRVCCEPSPQDQIQAQEFYRSYATWCESRGKPPINIMDFGRLMTQKFDKVEISGKRYYTGLRIKHRPAGAGSASM
jgi:cytoskeletal protein CcmA (bactofilin family)